MRPSALPQSACDPATAPPPRENPPISAPASPETPPIYNNGPVADRQRQADFLNRIRQAEPQFKTIERALLNEKNELGLILDRSVSIDDIPALVRTMLTQMAREFPSQDLTVVAYAPSNPPMKIGTGTFDLRSRDIKFTRVQH